MKVEFFVPLADPFFKKNIWFLHASCQRIDLKPENILLDSEAKHKVKIADFGLAKNNRNTVTRGVGTPVYMVRGALLSALF